MSMMSDIGTRDAGQPDGERHDRPFLVAFLADGDTEVALRDGLADLPIDRIDLRRGGVRAAIGALQRSASPQVLIVDVGGEKQPLTALGHLSEVVEPDVRVLVIGDATDMDSYRQITRGLGALEYLPKPVTRERVARHFAPLVTGQLQEEAVTAGRFLTVTGVVGGVGATTIAANLAWHFAVDAKRHTVLLDPDLQLGDAALLLDVKAGAGLRAALETPDRIDSLFVERATQPVSDDGHETRLHVLAGEEPLTGVPLPSRDAASRLVDALGRRYNMIVADVPCDPLPLYRDFLGLAHQRIFVMVPTLAAMRAALRLLTLPPRPGESGRPVIVLNRLGMPGGLSRSQVEEGLKAPVDIVISDMPRQLGHAATLGRPAAAGGKGTFSGAIAQLAQQVAFVRLLDSAVAPAAEAATQSSRWSILRKLRP